MFANGDWQFFLFLFSDRPIIVRGDAEFEGGARGGRHPGFDPIDVEAIRRQVRQEYLDGLYDDDEVAGPVRRRNPVVVMCRCVLRLCVDLPLKFLAYLFDNGRHGNA